MRRALRLHWLGIRILAWVCLAALRAEGAGSGLNTLVVINQSSSNSCQLGNYYCERRQVPPQNVLYIAWTNGNTTWTSAQFQDALLNPLLAVLSERQLTHQIDFVVLAMDIPFRVSFGSTVDSTTAALFYGLKPDGGTNWAGVANSYAASEAIFRQSPPASAPGYAFLTAMLTDESLPQALQLVEQGVTGDSSFPSQTVLLAKTSDTARNVRFTEFDNAIFNSRLQPNYTMVRTNTNSLVGQRSLLGCQTGLNSVDLSPNTFVPGSIADNLNSYGGLLFTQTGQGTLLDFIHAGAAASYGTVTEPSSDPAKFPNPQVYFYQSRGFSMAESYYQSLSAPYLGLIVGDPLAAPFARKASGEWQGLSSNTVLSGVCPMALSFHAADAAHPLQQVDLFVDGIYFQTLTNLAPAAGNVLAVTLNGYPVAYTVPTNATIAGVAAGLAAQLNDPAVTNATRIAALLHGDRIELRSLGTNSPSGPFYYQVPATGSNANIAYRAVYPPGPLPPQLRLGGRDPAGSVHLHVETPFATPTVLEVSPDLRNWSPLYTNPAGGALDIIDLAAAGAAQRFYRAASVAPDTRLVLSGRAGSGGFHLHVDARSTAPYLLQSSPDLLNWSDLYTNQQGGLMDLVQSQTASAAFFRAVLVPPPLPNVAVSSLQPAGGTLLTVSGAAQAYVIQATADQVQWTSLATNLMLGTAQTAVSASPGSAAQLSTFLTASRDSMLDSPTEGTRNYNANGVLQTGTWLQLAVAKTNGDRLAFGVTNQGNVSSLLELASQLTNLVNSSPALLGPDGLAAEDLGAGLFGAASFNLRSRSPGISASALQASLNGTARLVLNPKTGTNLNANLSDLQPRNHLYVSAGASELNLAFLLDTALLPDGFHELIAVAYEGTHVRTQTQATLGVQVQNTPLTAELAWLDAADAAPADGVYHLQVSAGTNDVSSIRLFSTGGLLAVSTNAATATFRVSGAALGAGLHPFYAVVEAGSGATYRTATSWLRLVAPLQ